MIELIFSDSAAGSLMCAKRPDNSKRISGIAVKRNLDENGNETSQPYKADPVNGVSIDGSAWDVAGIWLVGNIGDISDMSNWKKRIKSINTFFNIYDNLELDWSERAANQTGALIERIKHASKNGEKIRIWWSNSPEETCGFYWAMTLLENTNADVTQVKMPHYILKDDSVIELADTSSLQPEMFSELLPLEKPVPQLERKYFAKLWNNLVVENSPIRGVINGKLCSLPENFYDFVLKKSLPTKPVRVAYVIGTAVTKGPYGITDWWYAYRLYRMIENGEVEFVEQKKPFLSSLVRKTK